MRKENNKIIAAFRMANASQNIRHGLIYQNFLRWKSGKAENLWFKKALHIVAKNSKIN